ncbi:Streptothricin hydrolase [Thalassovita gelatinovora]|uniref:Streptothricin hydrolase n=1 Tax=Thalassovita gelatinovora TaxID=53501 RepID=A0A0P1F7I2_THAGE|nr:cysteine hydrolase family protein [Thalassovita gelatinovora]QIZ80157.1 cysteine hydrolase [Thalassovita gelatinovora]CUH63955.1 Streptothricin hydrolase [Thalassovita gelatinovora]SEQ80613.1 Nicotinamidase-related amidase [Thalassovita gelatinovora]
MSKTALILVDIQNDYFASGTWPVALMDKVAENSAKLLARARDTGMTVIHIRHETAPGAPFFQPGSEGAEIHDSVAPNIGETVVTKHRPNSFHQTGLLDMLRRDGIETLILCGAQSQMCIDATTRAAVDHGFKVVLPHDACGAKEATFGDVTVPPEMVQAAFMAPLAMSYAKVATTTEVLLLI